MASATINFYYIMTETWKEISGYEGLYEVSDLGRVKSLNYNRTGMENILKPGTNHKGYLQLSLYKDGHVKTVKVHRLVAEAFIPNTHGLETVNHKDEDKTNNVASNLEWMTRADNKRYSANKSVQMFDKETGELLATFPSTMEASRITGIKQPSISECCRGKLKSTGGYIWRYA